MKLHAYRHVNVDRPDWAPLNSLVRRLAAHPDLPAIDPADFMWMGQLPVALTAPRRCTSTSTSSCGRYLNVDTDLRTYVYVDGDQNRPFFNANVYFRRLRGIAGAVERLELVAFALPDNVVPLATPRPPAEDPSCDFLGLPVRRRFRTRLGTAGADCRPHGPRPGPAQPRR